MSEVGGRDGLRRRDVAFGLAGCAMTGSARVDAHRPYARIRKIGAYSPGKCEEVRRFAAYLGVRFDWVEAHGDRNAMNVVHPDDWRPQANGYVTSLGWAIKESLGLADEIRVALPLFAQGGSLRSGARGDYDRLWTAAARRILSVIPAAQPTIVVRPGWEMNGDFQPWSVSRDGRSLAPDLCRLYVESWRRLVALFRAASTRFRFAWVGNFNSAPCFHVSDPGCYPGDDVVDFIGLDWYYGLDGFSASTPRAAWTHLLDGPCALAAALTFAKARGKPLTIPEWGVDHPGMAELVRDFYLWQARNAEWIDGSAYWDSNAAYASKVSDGAALQENGAMMRMMLAPG